MSAKSVILNRLAMSPRPLALFELNLTGISENAAATRLSELAREGKVVGTYRQGAAYKEWSLKASVLAPVVFRDEDNGQRVFC